MKERRHALKRLTHAQLESAIAKAEQYRDINRPEEAESICRDVLDVDQANQAAWRILGLAITDRCSGGQAGLLEEAIAAFERLEDTYDRVYHIGIAWERVATVHLGRNEAHSAVAALEHALSLLEQAQQMRPALPDPVLRWNRCVRLLSSHPSLRSAVEQPRELGVRFGE